MNKCETCKFWDDSSGMGECTSVLAKNAACSEMHFAFCVPKDFGCIYHEPKDDPMALKDGYEWSKEQEGLIVETKPAWTREPGEWFTVEHSFGWVLDEGKRPQTCLVMAWEDRFHYFVPGSMIMDLGDGFDWYGPEILPPEMPTDLKGEADE